MCLFILDKSMIDKSSATTVSQHITSWTNWRQLDYEQPSIVQGNGKHGSVVVG